MTIKVKRIRSAGLELTVETAGEGSPVIFAHGLTSNRHRTIEQLAPLVRDYMVIAFDQRGHCDSTPVTDAKLYDPHRMADDLAAILDSFGIDRAIVGGESMGAATALLFALRHPQRVDRLLLTGPAFGDGPNPGRDDLKRGGRLIAETGIEGYLSAVTPEWAAMGMEEAAIAAWSAVQRTHDRASLAAACAAVADWVILPDLGVLAAFPAPVQLIAWEGDTVHALELARRMAAALPSARLHVEPALAPLFNDATIPGRVFREFLLTS
jgi:pimeloyl-ACP methyl ester carboxylesterase